MKSYMKIVVVAGMLAGVLGIGYPVPEPALSVDLKKTLPNLQSETTIAPGIKTIPVARTHCNGTCMCTGADCTQKWQDDTCSDTPTCSSDGAGTKICSCKKRPSRSDTV